MFFDIRSYWYLCHAWRFMHLNLCFWKSFLRVWVGGVVIRVYVFISCEVFFHINNVARLSVSLYCVIIILRSWNGLLSVILCDVLSRGSGLKWRKSFKKRGINVRTLTLDWEHTIKNAMRQVEEMSEHLSDALRLLLQLRRKQQLLRYFAYSECLVILLLPWALTLS